MTHLEHLKKKFAILEKKFEVNPKAKTKQAKILKQAEKLQDKINKLEGI